MMKFALICILAVAFISSYVAGLPSCRTLPANADERLKNPCSFVVTYSFYVPNGVSLQYLQQKASDSLNNTQLLSLTPTCQGALARYVCAQVYRKCVPGVNPTNPATFDNYIYKNDTGLTNVPLPFQRPCVSVCSSVASMCADPLYVFSSGGFPNCFTKYNYAGSNMIPYQPYQYDLQNNQSHCYSPNLIPLSGPKEKYIRGNTPCSGIVDEVFILPGTSLNSNFTVLTPPTLVQNAINSRLTAAFQSLPVWLSTDCLFSLKQYFCYQAFFRPQAVSVRQGIIAGIHGTPLQGYRDAIITTVSTTYPGLLNSVVYFPRYANRTICNRYTTSCQEFRDRAQIAQLEPHCSATSSGFELFPMGNNQTLLTKPVTVMVGASPISMTLKFQTEPDYVGYYNASETGYETQCPPNYSLNPDPGNGQIDEVPGTGCAVNCRTGFWTDSEWKDFDDFGVMVSGISIAFCVIVILTILCTNDWKSSYLIFLFTITSLIGSAYHFSITSQIPWEHRFCVTEVLRRRREAGASDCIRHSILSSFFYLAGCLLVFLMSLQRAFELSGRQSVLYKPSYNIFQFLIAIVPPLVAVALGWAGSFFGFAGSTPWCSMDLVPSVYLMGFPTLVICGFTYIAYIAATYLSVKGKSAKVAVAGGSYSSLSNAQSENVQGQGAHHIVNHVNTPTKAVTVISIGANVDVSPVRAFDEDDHHHQNPNNHVPAAVQADPIPQNAANSVGATPQMATDIELYGNEKEKIEDLNAFGQTGVMTEASAHTLRMNIVLSAFIFGGIVIHIGWVILKFGNFYYSNGWYDSFVNFSRCIFRNWDTQSDDSYTSVCGFHPASRPPHDAIYFYIICLFGNMLVMGPVYLISSFVAYLLTRNRQPAAPTSKFASAP